MSKYLDVLKSLDLLKEYLEEYIDHYKPMTLDFEIKYWSEHGRMPTGHNGGDFISFDIWKKVKIFIDCNKP